MKVEKYIIFFHFFRIYITLCKIYLTKWNVNIIIKINKGGAVMHNDFNNGMFLGILIAAVIVLVVRKRVMKNKVYRYDERQELIRGRAYRASFFAMIYFICIVLFAEFLFDRVFFDHWAFAILIIIVGITINVVYSIFNDAYFYANMNRKNYIVFLVVVGLINLVSGLVIAIKGGVIENHMITFKASNLFVTILIGAALISIYIKGKREKEEVDE